MARWPEEEWLNQQVHGKDVRLGLGKETEAKLRAGAVDFRGGKVPESEKWEDVLGLEKSKPAAIPNPTIRKGERTLVNKRDEGEQRWESSQCRKTSRYDDQQQQQSRRHPTPKSHQEAKIRRREFRRLRRRLRRR